MKLILKILELFAAGENKLIALLSGSHGYFIMADGDRVVLYPTPAEAGQVANVEMFTGCTFANFDVPVTELRLLPAEGVALDGIEQLVASVQPNLAIERIAQGEAQLLRIAH